MRLDYKVCDHLQTKKKLYMRLHHRRSSLCNNSTRYQLIISHTVNGHFGLGRFRPFMGSITNSETYKMSQFSPTCFLRS